MRAALPLFVSASACQGSCARAPVASAPARHIPTPVEASTEPRLFAGGATPAPEVSSSSAAEARGGPRLLLPSNGVAAFPAGTIAGYGGADVGGDLPEWMDSGTLYALSPDGSHAVTLGPKSTDEESGEPFVTITPRAGTGAFLLRRSNSGRAVPATHLTADNDDAPLAHLPPLLADFVRRTWAEGSNATTPGFVASHDGSRAEAWKVGNVWFVSSARLYAEHLPDETESRRWWNEYALAVSSAGTLTRLVRSCAGGVFAGVYDIDEDGAPEFLLEAPNYESAPEFHYCEWNGHELVAYHDDAKR